MKNRRLLLIALTILVGIAAFTLVKRITKQSPASTKHEFIVGTAAGYAPFVSINEQGAYEGFDIDVAHALAEELNKTLVIKDLGSMAALFIALDQGTIDAIIWGLSITQDRLNKVAMVRYYGDDVTAYNLLFWDAIPTGLTSIDTMQNMTVAVEPGSAQEAALERYPLINKLYVDKIDDALLNIQYGKADAALVEPAIAQKFQKKFPQLRSLPLPLAPEDQEQGIGIALKQDNKKLSEALEAAVAALRAQGVIEQLAIKWGIA